MKLADGRNETDNLLNIKKCERHIFLYIFVTNVWHLYKKMYKKEIIKLTNWKKCDIIIKSCWIGLFL